MGHGDRLWNTIVELDQSSVQFSVQTEKELKELRRRPPRAAKHLEILDEDEEVQEDLRAGITKHRISTDWVTRRDLARCVQNTAYVSLFAEEQGLGQVMLGRILSAVAGACPDVGYCQGMNYLAAAMILGRLPVEITGGIEGIPAGSEDVQVNHEERKDAGGGRKSLIADIIKTFTADSRVLYEEDRLQAEFDVYMLIRKLELRGSKFSMVGMWEIGTPNMKLKVYQLDSIMRWAVPRLHKHFGELGFTPEILVSQWFMTHFSYTLPLKLLLRLWDYTFLAGWPGIYRVVSLCCVSWRKPCLLVTSTNWQGSCATSGRVWPR